MPIRKRIIYEWDCETPDEAEDDIYHNHGTLEEVLAASKREAEDGIKTNIVLVRDVWDEDDQGLLERCWAYVEGGQLPEFFALPQADGQYHPIGIRVPKKFRSELERAMKGGR